MLLVGVVGKRFDGVEPAKRRRTMARQTTGIRQRGSS
jgi:hypothetical protein